MNNTLNRPVITHKKWWHGFVPSYRKNIRILDDVFAHDWKNGGEEEYLKHMREFMLTGKTQIGDKIFYLKDY